MTEQKRKITDSVNYIKSKSPFRKHPELAITEQIVALPVLIKKFPVPEIRMVGDLSNTEEVLKGLGIV